jgi:hypothetical protein
MSFRLFVYYCGLCGAGGALVGWGLGRCLSPGEGLLGQGIKGLWLGVALALALALVDALWSFPLRQAGAILGRVATALLLGGLAGLFGGLLGEALYSHHPLGTFLVLGYTLVGLLIGASIGVFDLLAGLAGNQETRGALRKVRNGLLGGALGGALGGTVCLLVRAGWARLFEDRPPDLLWSPSAAGFAALGACIGLMIALAQVILKEAWLEVVEGFRPGRAILLSRPQITIGRAETADVGLFGDPGVGLLHATIALQGDDCILQGAAGPPDAPGETFVNGEPLRGPRVLRSGDLIRAGRSVLRFGERGRRKKDEG